MDQASPIDRLSARRPRWGRLQTRTRRAFLASDDGEVTTSELSLWCWPRIVLGGGKPSWVQIGNQARAALSIGARPVRRQGRERVWRLPAEVMARWR